MQYILQAFLYSRFPYFKNSIQAEKTQLKICLVSECGHSNASYPWTSFQNECHNQFGPCHVAAKIEGYTLVEENNEQALKAAVAKQPVSVQIEADSDVFRFYKSGILKNSGCGTALDHAVLAVGYGNQDGLDYRFVKFLDHPLPS